MLIFKCFLIFIVVSLSSFIITVPLSFTSMDEGDFSAISALIGVVFGGAGMITAISYYWNQIDK